MVFLTCDQRDDDAGHQSSDEADHGVEHVGYTVERLQASPAKQATRTDE